MSNIPFIDLQAQRHHLGSQIEDAMMRVLDHGKFIMGPEVQELEEKLCHYSGAKHCISCANGTDAITLALMAEGIGPGDTVFVPSFTFIATAEAPAQLGATPFFVDVREDTFNIDPESLIKAIIKSKKMGLTPRAIISVDLFGLPANYPSLNQIAMNEGLVLIADAAQSFGGAISNKKVGTFADYTTTSFFPSKPLGCYGDGGAVFTDNSERADLLRSLRVHGKGTDKYDNVRIGLNSRLDTIQAAVLLQKLKIFDEELVKRNLLAQIYSEKLSPYYRCPQVDENYVSAWAQYTLIVDDPSMVQKQLEKQSIASAVYYPKPVHLQDGYRMYYKSDCLNISESLAQSVISLPMHPYSDDSSTEKIISALM